MKKILSVLLALVMVISMMPMTIAASLPVNGNNVDITDTQAGPYTLKHLEVYFQGTYEPVSIVSAEQDGTIIDIVLSDDTDPSAKLQAGLVGSGQGILQHMGNTCTLENGAGTMNYQFRVAMGPQAVGGGSYTINFTTEGPSGPALKFISNLLETEIIYVQDKPSTPLTVSAEYIGGETENTVTYRWYKNTEKNTETGEAIDGAIEESFTPDTHEIGTLYYYVVASCDDLTKTSNIATVTVEAPSLKINTNLIESEVKYIQGKTATDLTFDVEYTGITEDEVLYQWYKNDEESTDDGEAIDGATDNSFTPATDEIGTTYYYATASCEGMTVTSNISTVTVEAPSLKINTNLNEAEVKYIQGKTATDLTFDVEYTGITEDEVLYQWYKNDEESTDDGEAIDGATDNSFTPATDEIGTTYYYATASCEGMAVTSNISTITVTEIPTLDVTDNVIDITDKDVYTYSRYYAKATNIKISGADVERATEDGTTVDIVLDGFTNPGAEISVEFGTSLNRCTMSDYTGQVKLNNGEAQLVMTLTGQYVSSLKGSCTYTINFSLGEAPEMLPERIVEEDSKETYNGVVIEIDLNDYFNLAKSYYLINGEEKTLLESNIYVFKSDIGGRYSLVFGASNDTGECPDYVKVTVEVTEIKSGLWLNITTSNGSVNFVRFSDEGGNEIEGLTASLEDKNIVVSLPRSYDINGKITAAFDLTQTETSDGKLPFISGSNAFNQGVGTTTAYASVLSGGMTKKTLYLYNSKPKATSNNYTTYTISYAVQNEIPALAESQNEPLATEIIAGENYTIDLAPLFTDADGDELSFSVKINGEEAVSADTNFSFAPTLGGTYELEFFASDFMATSADSYKVTLNVTNSKETYDMSVLLPDDITPAFYITNGYDENGTDILGDILTAVKGESEDGNTAYTVSVPENISLISVRDESYGGMAIPASSGSNVKLCKVQTEIIDFSDKVISGTYSVSYGDYKAVGDSGKFLLIPEAEYAFTASPENSSVYSAKTETINITEDVDKVTIKVPYKNPKTVITTTGAVVNLFRYQNNYFVHTVYSPLATVDNGNGTSTHYFAADGDLSYRVSMEDKITKAGYMKIGNSVTVLHTEDDNLPTDRTDYFTETSDAATVGDDSVLLNINQQNHLSLEIGEAKTIKAYRTWQIIDLTYNNHIIEPDFHFDILSGEDVISLEPIENQPTTNGSGNWQKLTAIGEGTAVVEVTYDAIEITGSSFDGLYGASDPSRCGLFVVTVGADAPGVDFGIESKASAGSIVYAEANKKPWDSELDTLYFIGENGEIKLSPSFAQGNIAEVAVSGDKGESYTVLEAIDGVYTAPIVSGNNIIRVTTDEGIAYKIVRGDKVELKVKNNTHPGKPIEAGDEVSLTLIGVHTPVAKIAGTYNPGYKNNTDGDGGIHLHYSYGEEIIKSEGKQYNFSKEGTTVKFTVPENTEKTEFTLTDGYIGLGVIGVTAFPDDGESHRNIPDSGGLTRGSKTSFHTRSILPDITVKSGMLPSDNTAPYIRENAPKTATLSLGKTYAISMSKIFADRDGDTLAYQAKLGDGEFSVIEEYYTFKPDAEGTYEISFIANDGTVDSDIHTLILTVKEKESSSSSSSSLVFDISGDEVEGYVKVSFSDNGKRVEGEKNVTYPKALGTIISSTKVPYKKGDTVADVTLRLLDAMKFSYQHSGTTKDGFYLASIGDFTLKGIDYDTFGEFDAGSGSGWMITLNKTFIEYGASEFEVKNGDVVKWQYTCQLGADIGDPFYKGSSSSKYYEDDEKEPEKKEEEKKPEENPAEKPEEKPAFTETTFADVKKGDWYYDSVKYVYENKIMQGTENGFEPESTMTRAMLVTVLYRMANGTASGNNVRFSDVSKDMWYSEAVLWATENNIVSGVGDNKFAPDKNITREQMALIIYRFAKMQGHDVSEASNLENYTDASEVSSWALGAVKWANKTELVNGTSETTLSPKASATRAQVAAILMRFCENVAK